MKQLGPSSCMSCILLLGQNSLGWIVHFYSFSLVKIMKSEKNTRRLDFVGVRY